MPKILQNPKGGTIIWDSDDFLGGLHPQESASLSYNQKRNGLSQAKGFNPFRYLGYACPGYNPANVTNTSIVDALILNGAVYGANSYMSSAGAKLYKQTLSTEALVNAGDWPHTIAGTTPAGQDIAVYPIGTTNYLFYTYNNSTQGQLGRNDFGANFVDDYLTNASYLNKTAMSGTTTAPISHPMYVSPYDGNLYIGDGRNVHSLDGSAGAYGTWSASVFQVPQGYRITSFAEVPNYLVIFAYYDPSNNNSSYELGKAKAYFWDYFSGKATKIIDLGDNYVSAGFNWKGTVGCFTNGRKVDLMEQGNTKRNRLQIYNGTIFKSVTSFQGEVLGFGSVDIRGDMIYWTSVTANNLAEVYSWGSPYSDYPSKLQRLAYGTGNTFGGMLKSFTAVSLFLSSGTTTNGGLQSLKSDYSACEMTTSFAEPPFPPNTQGKIKDVKILYGKAVASGASTFFLRLIDRDTNTNTTVVDENQTVALGNLAQKFVKDSSGNSFPSFDALKLRLLWDIPAATDALIVSRVEVNYELISI